MDLSGGLTGLTGLTGSTGPYDEPNSNPPFNIFSNEKTHGFNFDTLQQSLSYLHKEYDKMKSDNLKLQLTISDIINKKTSVDIESKAEQNKELISLQAGIIQSLRKDNAKLKKDNELLTDILLGRCIKNARDKSNNKN